MEGAAKNVSRERNGAEARHILPEIFKHVGIAGPCPEVVNQTRTVLRVRRITAFPVSFVERLQKQRKTRLRRNPPQKN
jgi:hypothetical protein